MTDAHTAMKPSNARFTVALVAFGVVTGYAAVRLMPRVEKYSEWRRTQDPGTSPNPTHKANEIYDTVHNDEKPLSVMEQKILSDERTKK